MDLKYYLEILRRRKWVIAITIAVTVISALIATLLIKPSYQATTTLRIATANRTTVVQGVGFDDVTYADRLMNTYTRIATSQPILDELAKKLGVTTPPKVTVDTVAGTELMRLNVKDRNPVLAKDAANILGDLIIADFQDAYTQGGKTAQQILSEQITKTQQELTEARASYQQLITQRNPDPGQVDVARQLVTLKEEAYNSLEQQYEQSQVTEALRSGTISVIEPADTPTSPVEPRKELNLTLGLLIGLIVGVGLAFLLENLDTKLYSERQIEEVTELPTMGKIPAAKKPQPTAFFPSNSPQEEAFRRLRTNLFTYKNDLPLKTFLVTSAEPDEGKSTTVANLARAIAQAGRTVLAVDCDLRAPTLHKAFGLPNQVGVSTVLTYEANLADAVQFTSIAGVQVLTSGALPPNPAELLGSGQMAALIRQLAQQYEFVLIDTPAMLAATDAAVLAPAADSVLLVVRCAKVRREAVQAAREQLANVRARLVNLVINGAAPDHRPYHYNVGSQ